MDTTEKDLSQCVRVAVNIRPLITGELMVGCTDCITLVPGEPQVQIGSHAFTFDYVFGGAGSPSSTIFDQCVAPLVESLFHGYNATVLAYGQTGSGKTYTMGTNYNDEASNSGIIPKVMQTIFAKVDALKDSVEFLIRVSFIEIFKEEVFDLLDQNSSMSLRTEGVSQARPTIPARVPIQIRETPNGGITLAGVTEAEVRSKEEMASFLAQGSLSRATGSTNMNSQSRLTVSSANPRMMGQVSAEDDDDVWFFSRSHAIFTITMEQKRKTNCASASVIYDETADDILCAKLHLVDLAGSERAKRTGADGLRFKEGIHINKGLLALGNVISALGDEKKRKEGGHVPYRDSKLTRLLQDSLGGNSRTVMIACVSPADTNAEETLNTLKYANRARNIQNKAIINRDPMTAQLQRMRGQLEQLQAELVYYRGEGTPFEELQILRHRVSELEASNAELHQELHKCQATCDHLAQCAVDAQVEKDKLLVKVQSARNGQPWDEIDNAEEKKDFDMVKSYVSKIQELEGKLLYLQSSNNCNRNSFVDCLDLEDDGVRSKDTFLPGLHDGQSDCDGVEEVEKELEHSSVQDKLGRELQELDKRLEQKEAEMKRFAKVDNTSVLQQHYEKKLMELEHEKKSLLKEIDELRANLSNLSSTNDDGAQKLKEDYLQKLNALEAQVSELKRKQEAHSQLLRQKQKSEDAAKRLQDEIQRIKTQKVQLQHKIKQESEQFRSWKASREKEVLQLKKEGRRNEYEMHKLLALNQRQKMVLQRKTEEASMATRRLKELLEAKKSSSREILGVGSANGPSIQALMQAIEHELEVTVRVHEVRSEYERQMEVRSAMANEVARLKKESEMIKQKSMSDDPQAMSPGARNSRIFALENMLATSSSTLVSMASQLSEAEERERVFSGRGRWNQVRSLAEAKNLMNFLFNLLSSSRCQLRDKEVDCREKELVIKELKEKIVRLTNLIRQMEAQLTEMRRQEKSQRFATENGLNAVISGAQTSIIGDGRHYYDLRKGPRSSYAFNFGGINMDSLEDMDISDSDQSDPSDADWEENEQGKAGDDSFEARKRLRRKRRSKTDAHPTATSALVDAAKHEILNSENIGEEEAHMNEMPTSALCCTCGRKSSCKTNKCECRAAGGMCGESCACAITKCANRENGVIQKTEESLQSEMTENGGNNIFYDAASIDDIEKNRALASHGARLLQSALKEKPVEVNGDDAMQRKPLSDIGNTKLKSNALKQSRRKKWKKSIIQLVPTAPTSAQPENNDVPAPADIVTMPDIPLKLPRAMNITTISSNLLRERNANPTGETIGDKEINTNAPRSPTRRIRETVEKENKWH